MSKDRKKFTFLLFCALVCRFGCTFLKAAFLWTGEGRYCVSPFMVTGVLKNRLRVRFSISLDENGFEHVSLDQGPARPGHYLVDGGLLYLPRLFVYHSVSQKGSEQSETFKVMERRLYKAIMTPAMVTAWLTGLTMVWLAGFFQDAWLLAKLCLVIFAHDLPFSPGSSAALV